MMTNSEFVAKLIDVAKNYKTLYVMGCFGAPMTSANKKRYTQNHSYNRQASRTAMINKASADTFGFDCVCLIKGLLWGWKGDKNAIYGGATYASNGVPDYSADGLFKTCKDVSKDFSKIEIGEAVWMEGHIGVYIGDGLAVECTPRWKNRVQITACNRKVAGYNRRDWTKHGRLPYITYVKQSAPTTSKTPETKTATDFKKGDLVKITGTKYYSGKAIPSWVRQKTWYVLEVEEKRVVIDKSEDGQSAICSAVHADDLQLVNTSKQEDRIYTVVKGDSLWSIAKAQLGSNARYTEIVKLNGLKTSVIYPGQKLKIPKK